MAKKTKKTKKTMCLCPYCLEAIRSRGERVTTSGIEYADEPIICDWCEEETEEYYEAEL